MLVCLDYNNAPSANARQQSCATMLVGWRSPQALPREYALGPSTERCPCPHLRATPEGTLSIQETAAWANSNANLSMCTQGG